MTNSTPSEKNFRKYFLHTNKLSQFRNLKSFLTVCFILFVNIVVAQQTTFIPSENFSANGDTGLNGFDGGDVLNTSDDLFYPGSSSACAPGDKILMSLVVDGTDLCEGSFRSALVTIDNNSGVTITNAVLNFTLTGTDAVYNGEPYDITNALRIAEANVLNPAYPAVPNALSGKSGLQSLDVFALETGATTFRLDYVLGSTTTDFTVEIGQLSTAFNASGTATTATESVAVNPNPVITAGSFAPATVDVNTTNITFSGYSTDIASTIAWTSGTNGSFSNASALNPTYTITDQDKANGYIDFSISATASGCASSETLRIPIDLVLYDYGDAPSSYDLNENAVPVAAGSTVSSLIYLGSTVPDTEPIVDTPSLLANGDGPEEDGLNTAVIPDVKPGQTYTLTVTATNNDPRPAYLRGFIDWNTDGDFLGDEGEASQEVIVPANSGNSSYPVEFTVPANVSSNLSDVIVRLRLSTDEFAAARTFGASANGEVEDFQIQPNVCLPLNLKVYLAGALIDNGGATGSGSEPLMRDNLRSSAITGQIGNNVIPALEPYTALAGFTHVGSGGGRSATATAFDDRGQNSVVDWVFIEFRDKNDNTSVLETMSALVQRDGDVVDIDGVSPIQLCTTEVEYFVAVRHRNHFGVMTASAENLRTDSTVDFSDNNAGGSGVFNYGTSHPAPGASSFDYTGLSQKADPSGVSALWLGNSLADGKIKFDAPSDDASIVLSYVQNFPTNPTSSSSFDFAFGYDNGDINMDGKIKFDAPDDDQSILLTQVQNYSLNALSSSSFDFLLEQLP